MYKFKEYQSFCYKRVDTGANRGKKKKKARVGKKEEENIGEKQDVSSLFAELVQYTIAVKNTSLAHFSDKGCRSRGLIHEERNNRKSTKNHS